MMCPHCGTAIPPSGERCPACARPLPGRTVAASVLTPPSGFHPPDDAATAAFVRPGDDTTGLPALTAGQLDDLDLTLPPMPADARTTAEDLTMAGDALTTLTGSMAAPSPRASRPRNPDDTGPLVVGQAFSARYHIIRVLGIGGMGAVYHAWDADLGVAVALKVIRPEATRDPATARELERRFKQELVLARQVTHKNVVRIHDMGEISGIKYITMPYLEGKDLATTLREAGTLEVPFALRIIRDVAAGLTAAHEAGIVHRDLKPANIMVLKDRAVIMDFGIARAASGPFSDAAPAAPEGVASAGTPMAKVSEAAATMTVVGTVLGTVQYMAPEQARGQAVDQRADVYALGLIFRDILLGKRRKSGADESALDELKRRIEKAPAPARSIDPAIPDAVDTFITRCLEPDPAARFQSSAEVVAALDLLDENGVPIPVKRVVRLPFVAAIVVLLLAVAAGVVWYQQQFIKEEEKAQISVIVADFQNGTNDPAFDNVLAQTARRGLEEATFISAIDRTRVRQMLNIPQAQVPAPLDEAAARQMAARQGLPYVVSGAIVRSGRGYTISVKAIETVSGNVIVDDSDTASTPNDVIATALSLMAQVRRELGDNTSESDQQFAMRSVSTSSLAVLGHYAAAVEAQSLGRFEEARQSYQKAVDLDPEFGLGYQGLAVMARNLSRPEESKAYIEKALEYVDKMTDREKMATRGFYYRMIGDNQQCAEEYQRLLAQYKADSVAYNQRAVCLAKLRNMREATESMRQAVAMVPKHDGYRTNLALMSAVAGDFEGAERAFREIAVPAAEASAAERESYARAHLGLAYSQIGRGMLAEAAATYQKIGGEGGALGASTAASGLGDLAMYQGRFSDAVRFFEVGAARDVGEKNPDRAAIKDTSAAFAHLVAGRKSEAIASADRALTLSRTMAVVFLAGRAYAEAGAIAKARAQAAVLANDFPPEPQAHAKILLGQIALVTGNPREAIKLLTEANAILNTWFGQFDLGRAFLAAGQLQQAESAFDSAISRRGEALSLMDEGPTYGHFPMAYYYQGQVRERLKRSDAAAEAYRAYLAIRGASQEDPLLADVRRKTGL